jgi:hypothetical protein
LSCRRCLSAEIIFKQQKKGSEMKVVRWLGAYRKNGSLASSLQWELNSNSRECAAEPLVDGKSAIYHAKIGLLVRRTAIIKVFHGDCWSLVDGGKLRKNRNPRWSTRHREAWVRPDYIAIVVKDWGHLRGSARKTLEYFGDIYGLPILRLKKGELVPIKNKKSAAL